MASRGRRAEPTLTFNGHNVSTTVRDYLTGFTFTDVASGSSDSISISMYDKDMIWLTDWYPTKGDKITGGAVFRDWTKEGDVQRIQYGAFILDSIEFSGNPLTCTFGGLAIPEDQSFKTRQRTKTWEQVSLSQIASEIAGRYGLGVMFNGSDYMIEALEQTDRSDSDFLYSTVKEYGLKMKVYNRRIVIFDAGIMEAAAPVCTISRNDFVDDAWTFRDELEGTYTGAEVGYKSDKRGEKEIKVTVGSSRRMMYINTSCETHAEAIRKAKAQVNEANESMTKLSGTLWGYPELASGVTVMVTGMGKASGKYYVEKVSTSISGSGGTKQSVEMHKCYRRL